MVTQSPEVVPVRLRFDEEMRKRLQMAAYSDWLWKTDIRRRGENLPELKNQYEISMTVIATLLYVTGEVDTYQDGCREAHLRIEEEMRESEPVAFNLT